MPKYDLETKCLALEAQLFLTWMLSDYVDAIRWAHTSIMSAEKNSKTKFPLKKGDAKSMLTTALRFIPSTCKTSSGHPTLSDDQLKPMLEWMDKNIPLFLVVYQGVLLKYTSFAKSDAFQSYLSQAATGVLLYYLYLSNAKRVRQDYPMTHTPYI